MAVEVNSERKGVEVAWVTDAYPEEPPDKPDGYPSHPIALPDPYPDQGLPGPQPGPEHPIYLPPVEGLPEYPAPVHEGTSAVQVFGQGQDGDW